MDDKVKSKFEELQNTLLKDESDIFQFQNEYLVLLVEFEKLKVLEDISKKLGYLESQLSDMDEQLDVIE